MAILIEGLEIPTERESFTITIKYNGLVFDTETGIQVAEAQEVPPHGDLIDRSHLCDDSIGGDYGSGIRVYYAYEVEHAPVIIPASKED